MMVIAKKNNCNNQTKHTFGSVFLAVVVVDPLLNVRAVVVVRDADNCLFTVSFNCFSVSGPPFVIVFVSGTLALIGGAVVGRGFVGDVVVLTAGSDDAPFGVVELYKSITAFKHINKSMDEKLIN